MIVYTILFVNYVWCIHLLSVNTTMVSTVLYTFVNLLFWPCLEYYDTIVPMQRNDAYAAAIDRGTGLPCLDVGVSMQRNEAYSGNTLELSIASTQRTYNSASSTQRTYNNSAGRARPELSSDLIVPTERNAAYNSAGIERPKLSSCYENTDPFVLTQRNDAYNIADRETAVLSLPHAAACAGEESPGSKYCDMIVSTERNEAYNLHQKRVDYVESFV